MKDSIHYKLLEVANDEKNLLKPVMTEELGTLMKDYGLTLDEAVILSFVLKYSMERSYVDMEKFENEYIKKGDRNYIRILKDLKNMQKKGVVLLNSESRRKRGSDAFNPNILIDESVFSKIVLGEDVYDFIDFKDTYSVIEGAGIIIDNRTERKISEDRFEREFDGMFNKIDIKLPIKQIAVKYSDIERIMLFKACISKLRGECSDDCNNFIAKIYESLKTVSLFMKKIYEQNMPIFKDRYLQLVERGPMFGFISSPDFELTEKAYEKIFDSRIKKKKKALKTKFTDHIKHNKITRELYFDKELGIRVDTISSALENDRFKQVRKELKAKGFAQGIVSLLYGYPGTGKTATVHEIARRTRRDILQVDIANINDKWVGESEKRLKEVFNEYRKAVKLLPRTPILLFNEADALISRRINVEDSVDQMRNNMQNIILEELEKFDGIFFATTNLTHNMDDAFSRRFLYKIEFTKPSSEVREKIWESKMKYIPKCWIKKLSRFDLTGGQIDNIVKKYMIDSILSNTSGLEELTQLCREEAEYKKDKTRAIGFCA
ncbi:MAG: ATP-binding protein [Spirochaetes bacterium]|nr:ATP-binding protein [Spirochaetota bacterium]